MPHVHLATDAVVDPSNSVGYRKAVQFAVIDQAATGNVVLATAGKRIRVLQYCLVCSSAVAMQWQSSGGANLSGAMSFAANGGIATPWSPTGHFETAAGEALKMTLGGPVQISGHLSYILV